MAKYFSSFPTVSYNGVTIRDITKRTNFIQNNLSNPYLFLPYTVKEGEKPEDIAYNYYGSIEATWLVLMCNNIIDPYTQWSLPTEIFDDMIIQKYAVQSGKTGIEVLNWAQNETILDNIVYYYAVIDGKEISVSPDTFDKIYDIDGNLLGRNVEAGYLPYRVYDYELDMNESKREILVVEKNYYPQIEKEFMDLMKK
jgi:hypothetical protein